MILRFVTLILSRARDLFRRDDTERELDDELRFHLERQVEAYVESGMSRREARRRARAEFGRLEPVKEECRQARPTRLLETVLRDVRHGLRVMRRYPGFSLTAVATLGLTIAAVSTVLTLGHTLFVKTLPVADPVEVVEVRATRHEGTELGFVSYPDYAHFRDATRTLEGLAAAYPTAPLYVTSGDRAREVTGAVVSADFFPLFGVEPSLGRTFRPEEDRVPGRDRVAVLGHSFWKTWFGGSSDALGSNVEINGTSFTVVGVAPPSFPGIIEEPTAIYIPTMMLRVGYRWCDDALAADCTMLRMVGRLEEGVTVDEVETELAARLPPRWDRAEPGDNSGVSVSVARRAEPGPSEVRFLQLMSLVGVALVLVCCANLAGLLVARGRTRAREMAIRTSLGAPRSRLVRQLTTESMLLALAGGALGLGLSVAMTRWVERSFYSADSVGRTLELDFTLDPTVLLGVLGVTLLAGLLFGVLPALSSVGKGGAAAVERRARTTVGSSGHGAGRWLLGGQAAAAVALTVLAALLAVSARSLVTGTGFEPSGVALLRLRPRLLEVPPERARPYVRSVVDRLEALPGVESVSMVGTGTALMGFRTGVSRPTSGDPPLTTGFIEVGPDYFETLGTPVLRGREFERRDGPEAPPVAVVSQALARRLWPGADAVGSTVLVDGRRHRVVGVVADAALQSRAEPIRPYVYTPYGQNPERIDVRLQVRVEGDPAAMLPTLAREARRVDPRVPVTDVTTLPRWLAGQFRPIRMAATAVSYAAVLAVLLSAVGLYASLSSAVSRRTREIGMRRAVGASAREILVMIVGQGMAVVSAGVVAGLVVALAAARLLRHMLYGSASGDAILYGVAALLVASIGLVASWVPARRAAGIDPMEAIRPD